MANSKAQQNAMALDPNRARIAKNMSVMPGGPENNHPDPVLQASAGVNKGTSIYNDYDQTGVYPAMNGAILNPENVPVSQLQQSNVMMRGKNQGPYGMQLQPDINGNSPVSDVMESNRLAMRADPALPKNAMGLAGMSAIPGGMPGNMPGTNGPPLMPGNPGMVPGSTPQKIGQKKKGGKA